MSQTPYLAVILEGGQVHSVIVQEWPDQIPLPRIAIVDYDTDGADEEDLTHFSIGNTPMVALCHSEIPDRYEDFKTSLSPKAVLTALGEPDDSGEAEKTHIEQSLSDYLEGYLRGDPNRRKDLLDFPDWPRMARLEFDRRGVRFLEILPS